MTHPNEILRNGPTDEMIEQAVIRLMADRDTWADFVATNTTIDFSRSIRAYLELSAFPTNQRERWEWSRYHEDLTLAFCEHVGKPAIEAEANEVLKETVALALHEAAEVQQLDEDDFPF